MFAVRCVIVHQQTNFIALDVVCWILIYDPNLEESQRTANLLKSRLIYIYSCYLIYLCYVDNNPILIRSR